MFKSEGHSVSEREGTLEKRELTKKYDQQIFKHEPSFSRWISKFFKIFLFQEKVLDVYTRARTHNHLFSFVASSRLGYAVRRGHARIARWKCPSCL